MKYLMNECGLICLELCFLSLVKKPGIELGFMKNSDKRDRKFNFKKYEILFFEKKMKKQM